MLQVENIQCQYEQQTVLDKLSFHINEGEIGCLLGASGCGKTTALRAIAGFQSLSAGTISLNQTVLSSARHSIEPEHRGIGMVFQDYALFPHLSVRDNLAFGIRHSPRAEQKKTVNDLLVLTRLGQVGERFPHELSGGQQQRVALARALAPNPKLLLLDEPFSNLDIDLRRHLNLEVRDILKQYGTTAILVTHDQEEAFAFADHIGLLNEGTMAQWDTAFNLFHEPKTRFVADFIGQGCFIPGLAVDQNTVQTELGLIQGNRAYPWHRDSPLAVLLRPDDIVLDAEHGINARIVSKVFSGSATLYTLRLPTGSLVKSLFPSHCDYAIGNELKVKAKVAHLIAFSPDE